MGRITTATAAFAALGVLTCGGAAGQAVQLAQGIVTVATVVIRVFTGVNVSIETANHAYNAYKFVADATELGISLPTRGLPLSEAAQRQRDAARIETLLAGIADIRTRLVAVEEWQRAAPDRARAERQETFYIDAYAHSELALTTVTEALALPPERRSADLMARLQTRLDDVSMDAHRAQAMGRGGWLGEHYVAGVHASAVALTSLRTMADAASLDDGKRLHMLRAIEALDRAIDFIESPDSTLNRDARDEAAAYRAQINTLAGRADMAQLIGANGRFLEGPQQACFEIAIYGTRPCEGTECLLPFPDPSRRMPTITGYEQTRYAFALTRTTIGGMNMMDALDPRVSYTSTRTTRVAPNCPQRGDRDEAWVNMVHSYNQGLEAAVPFGARATSAQRSLALTAATRQALARLRATL